jgi:hypothetical protein
LFASGAVLGLTDVDALTISMTTTAVAINAPALAAKVVAIGILVNCLMKMVLSLALGTAAFRRVTGAVLAAMAAAIVIALRVIH